MAKKAKVAGVTEPVNFLLSLTDEDSFIADDALSAGENAGWMDTGCYTLNLQLSGSIFGGVSRNRITVFAGEEATGKTFLVKSIMKHFMQTEKGQVLFYDSESAQQKADFADFGIDPKKVLIADKDTIQAVNTHALNAAINYLALDEDARPPMMFVLDSLGNLSSIKELEDISKGSNTRDMTKSQLIKAMFRSVTKKIGRARIPWLITNHVYDVIGAYVPTKKQSGGSGIAYNASTALVLTKSQDKDKNTGEVYGNVITSFAHKNRFAREKTKIKFKLSHKTGLDRYYGLLELAVTHGLAAKVGNKYEVIAGNDDAQFEKTIYKNPEKYFTAEWLAKFDEVVSPHFRYGEGEGSEYEEDELGENEYGSTDSFESDTE